MSTLGFSNVNAMNSNQHSTNEVNQNTINDNSQNNIDLSFVENSDIRTVPKVIKYFEKLEKALKDEKNMVN